MRGMNDSSAWIWLNKAHIGMQLWHGDQDFNRRPQKKPCSHFRHLKPVEDDLAFISMSHIAHFLWSSIQVLLWRRVSEWMLHYVVLIEIYPSKSHLTNSKVWQHNSTSYYQLSALLCTSKLQGAKHECNEIMTKFFPKRSLHIIPNEEVKSKPPKKSLSLWYKPMPNSTGMGVWVDL